MVRSTLVAVLPLAVAAVLASACSGKTDTAPSADSPEGGEPAGTSYTLTVGPLDVPAGTEKTQCVVMHLGNANAMHVNTIHNTLSQGSHHMIVYRSTETQEQLTPFDCVPFTDTLDPAKGTTLMVTQKKDDTLSLPDGVGFALDANQMVRIELHYINASAQPIQVTATSTFVAMDEASFRDAADFLFIGDPDIKIPAHSQFSLGPIFFQLPPEYAGVNFFAITGHEHQYGTNVTVSVAANATDPGASVYDVPNWLWSEPATVQATPPFQIPQNGGFRFTCDWDNTSDNQVSFGESANDEMCFFWAYYYPSQGAKVCMHTTQYMGGYDLCCPGPNLICAAIQGQIEGSDGGGLGLGGGGHGGGNQDGGGASDASGG